MRTVRATGTLDLPPDRALALWANPDRWPEFVEGFARVVEIDPQWPAPGAGLVWESGPEGRGRVAERVAEHEPGRRLVTELSEQALGGGSPRLRGRQALEVAAATDGAGDRGRASAASSAELSLEYELVRGRGTPGRVTDLLFVRRALRDALGRTLARFGAEAAREADR